MSIPDTVLNDALDLALDAVVWARGDEMTDAELWVYGRSQVDYWVNLITIRRALSSDR